MKRNLKDEGSKINAILVKESDFITKEELIRKIKAGSEEVKLYQEGKIKLKTLDEFLAEL